MTVEQVDGGLGLTGARSLSIPPPDDRHASSVAERSEMKTWRCWRGEPRRCHIFTSTCGDAHSHEANSESLPFRQQDVGRLTPELEDAVQVEVSDVGARHAEPLAEHVVTVLTEQRSGQTDRRRTIAQLDR